MFPSSALRSLGCAEIFQGGSDALYTVAPKVDSAKYVATSKRSQVDETPHPLHTRLDRIGVGGAGFGRVRMCGNKVVAGVRTSTFLPIIRPQDTRQIASAQHLPQFEGLAVAIPWGFESPLPHQDQRRPGFTGLFSFRLAKS